MLFHHNLTALNKNKKNPLRASMAFMFTQDTDCAAVTNTSRTISSCFVFTYTAYVYIADTCIVQQLQLVKCSLMSLTSRSLLIFQTTTGWFFNESVWSVCMFKGECLTGFRTCMLTGEVKTTESPGTVYSDLYTSWQTTNWTPPSISALFRISEYMVPSLTLNWCFIVKSCSQLINRFYWIYIGYYCIRKH